MNITAAKKIARKLETKGCHIQTLDMDWATGEYTVNFMNRCWLPRSIASVEEYEEFIRMAHL